MRQELRDPESAQFRNLERCGESDIVKGEVNGKNAYGAYAGFEPFYFADGRAEMGHSVELIERCTAAIKKQTAEIVKSLPADAQANIARDAITVDDMSPEIDEPAADAPPARGGRAPEVARSAPATSAPALCYKDYCPCDPPQGGPDQLLCDQLEEGIEVDVRMMIAGRGAREARRQMETGDY